MSEFAYPQLPKWPQMRVAGTPVTEEQALEIIRRTDNFFCQAHGGNAHEWNKKVRDIVGMPFIWFDDTEDRDYEELNRWQERWGCVHSQYPDNNWVSASFIFGPHGWCHPDGTIHYAYNVGKWPSGQALYGDWEWLAEHFPFLDLEVLIMSEEQGDEDTEPLVGYVVKGGHVTPYLPDDYEFFTGDKIWNDDDRTEITPEFLEDMISTPPEEREVGLPIEVIERWALENV